MVSHCDQLGGCHLVALGLVSFFFLGGGETGRSDALLRLVKIFLRRRSYFNSLRGTVSRLSSRGLSWTTLCSGVSQLVKLPEHVPKKIKLA